MAHFESKFSIGDNVIYEGIYGDTYTATIELIQFQADGIRYRARNRKDVIQTFKEDEIELKR